MTRDNVWALIVAMGMGATILLIVAPVFGWGR